jgi:hypothetical protein
MVETFFGGKRLFGAVVVMKNDHLPRQTQDKHEQSSNKGVVSAGDAVITTITGNAVPSASITSSLVNTAGLTGCNVSSWTLGL